MKPLLPQALRLDRFSRIIPAPERATRRQTRVVVRLVDGGFSALLTTWSQKRGVEARWQDGRGSWHPESAFRRLQKVARDFPVEFVLPTDLVLTQSVKLPEAALANLTDAISYGIPSWSPFQSTDVYVVGSADQVLLGQATIRLAYVVRARVDPLLSRLGAAGLPVDRLCFDERSGLHAELPTPKLRRLRRARRVDGLWAATALGLALVLGCAHAAILTRRLEEAEAAIRVELAQLHQDEALRTAYTALVARRASVARKRSREVSASELLAALARSLPDHAVLQGLEVGGGRGRVEFLSGDPDSILQALGAVTIVGQPKVEPGRASRPVTATFDLVRRAP